jgi:hypothetical protein
VAVKKLEDRQRERGGFARSGLRAAEQVLSFENVGDRLRLNLGGDGVTFGPNGVLQRLNEPQFVECHCADSSFLSVFDSK